MKLWWLQQDGKRKFRGIKIDTTHLLLEIITNDFLKYDYSTTDNLASYQIVSNKTLTATKDFHSSNINYAGSLFIAQTIQK